MPADLSRARSTAVRMPLSATAVIPGGSRFASRSTTPRSVRRVSRSRLLIPTRTAPASAGRSSLRLVVDLHQGVQAELRRPRQIFAKLRRREDPGDQQDGVGAHRPGFEELIVRDDEVFPQDRQRRRPSGPVAGRPGSLGRIPGR